MPTVTFVTHEGCHLEVDVPLAENVMRGALTHDIAGIVGECGGGLACATCHCYIDDAWTDRVGEAASQDERDMLESATAEVRPGSRLSCQIVMTDELDGLVVHLPETQF